MRTGSLRVVLGQLVLAVCAVVCVQFAATGQQACPIDVPLVLEDVELLLRGKVHPNVVRQRVQACGVSFIPDAGEVQRLRAAGAGDEVIALLTPPASPSLSQQWTPLTDRRTMVWIAAGTFSMGSPAGEANRDPDESAHSVTLARGFWMDTTEVTNEAYRRFVLQNPRWQKGRIDPSLHDGNYLRDWNDTDFPQGRGNLPVVYVSWHAARAYAAWVGKRLPTEAEWEYAARAGTAGAYWWPGPYDAAHANNGPARSGGSEDSARNPWGLYHMLGNVAEWVSSLYVPYPYAPDDGREDAGRTGRRVHRGGAWNQRDTFLRSANRNNLDPKAATDQLGFRCAR